ncbi:hypothetical protein F4820DRAFT_37683 [Hypoxylon rubiginosum]|uniref:Uncharacterized protein n=1 Tax=Hypoxylon rubiginosum TaxID=110542 RepID=A0ACB9YST1_9PEZI|nr:hypothetical protein F4820DRAFT_37683 [Hypoxylon rubiginosum]
MSTTRSLIPTLDKARTFPLSLENTTRENRHEIWISSEVTPYTHSEQKRVCFPNIEPWSPQDGERHLSSDLEALIKGLKARDRFLGLNAEIRKKWSIKFENANRRMEGSNKSSVPTIMVIAWDEDDREYSAADEELWGRSCKDMIMFLRDHDVAYLGVEIIHWDRLDYQVVI